MDELKWKWAFGPYLDPPEGQKESAIKAGYVKVVSKQSADEAIAELKAQNDSLLQQNHEICEALSVMYSKEEYNQLKAKLDEKDKELESLKASHYAEMVDAGMRERRLRRALRIARANSADGQFIYWCARFAEESGFTKTDIRGYSVNTKRRLRTIGEWIETWKNVRIKCLAKAEQYK